MSVYKNIVKGLSEAIEYEKGNLKNVKIDHVQVAQLPCFDGEEIKNIRTKKQMTQLIFSNILGVSIKTVEAWESGRNKPSGPAQRMLFILDNDESVLERNSIIVRQ